MAAGVSGYFDIAADKAAVVGRVHYQEQYDATSNTSSLTVWVQFKAGQGGWYGYTYYLTGSVYVDGYVVVTCKSTTGYDRVRWNALNTYAYMQAGTNADICWTRGGIAHEQDGSRTVNISVNLTGYTTDGEHGSGWNVYGGRNIALTVIPRASEIGATDANIGAGSMVAVTRRSSAYTHSIAYSFGSQTGYLTASGGVSAAEERFSNTSLVFTLPDSFYAEIPNARNGTCVLTCRTYAGDTQIGDAASCSFTATAADWVCAPEVSGTVEDANGVTLALTGDKNKLVRYFSTALCTITATAKNGASIQTRRIAGAAVSGSTRSIANVEQGSFYFQATDSRGYTGGASVSKAMVDYVRLTCDGTVSRPSPTGSTAVLSLSGNWFNASFGAAANALAVTYAVNGGAAVSLTPVKSGNTWSAAAELTGVTYTNSYTITVSAADRLTTVTKSFVLSRGTPVFDWGAESFRINKPLGLTGGLDATAKRTLLDFIYPVGSYYWSSSATSPAVLFGGSWTRITRRFLFAAADEAPYRAGSQGGEEVHWLSVNELPSHCHTYDRTAMYYVEETAQKSALGADGSFNTPCQPGTGYTGGNQAHNNMPPWLAAYCWQRTA